MRDKLARDAKMLAFIAASVAYLVVLAWIKCARATWSRATGGQP